MTLEPGTEALSEALTATRLPAPGGKIMAVAGGTGQRGGLSVGPISGIQDIPEQCRATVLP